MRDNEECESGEYTTFDICVLKSLVTNLQHESEAEEKMRRKCADFERENAKQEFLAQSSETNFCSSVS